MKSLIIVFFTLFFWQIRSQKMEIRNLNTDPILILKTNNCAIQTGIIKILHPINITNLEKNVNLFLKISRDIDDTLPISELIRRKSRQLVSNLHQVKPAKSRRIKRWDAIGTTWKWIAGNPDAEDLRLINTTLNELIDQNNEQIKINGIINERIQGITEAVNRLINENTMQNTILLKELDAISILLYMDTINNILQDIEDAILRTRVSIPNSKLLTLKEILLIETIVNEQGINTDFPDDALNYVTPKIISGQDILLYIIQIPKIEENAEIMRIIPLIVNGTMIMNIPSHVIRSGDKIFTTSDPHSFIQQKHQISKITDECIYPLISGLQSHCNASEKTDTIIDLVTENKILVNNAKQIKISSNCGPHNRTLTGNFIITFKNCSVQIGNQSFTTREILGDGEQLSGVFPGLSVNLTVHNTHNMTSLATQMMLNRKKLNHIQLKQFDHRNWMFGITGGLLVTMVITIMIIIFCIQRKKVVIKVRYPHLKRNKTPKKATPMDEDVHSSPPGRVT